MRIAFLAIVLAVVAPSAQADEPAAATRQFIEKTHITVPRDAGRFEYTNGTYDPARMELGVSAQYGVDGAPADLAMTVYVYPQGLMAEADAVAAQAKEVEAGVRQYPDYTDVTAGERTVFTVALPEAPKPSKRKKHAQYVAVAKPGEGDAGAAPDTMEKALAEPALPSVSTGSRQGFTFTHQGMTRRSAGLVFYRHLYNIKVRVSVPADTMTQADFDALVDDFARTVVPRIEVQNFGTCGDVVLPASEGASEDAAADAGAAALLRGFRRLQRDNCASAESDAPDRVPKDRVRNTLVFPPDLWKNQG